MAISQFPTPSTGGAAGGASLPEGAVAKIVEGKLTSAGYNYPETLPAGTYRVNANGNSVIVNAADNGQTESVGASKDITLANNESNLSFDVASNFAGDATVLVDLPVPVYAWSQSYPKTVDFAMSPNGEYMIESKGQGGNNNYIGYGMRTDKGAMRYMNQIYLGNGDARYSAVAVDDNGFGYVGYATGSGFYHNIHKIDPVTGAQTLVLAGSTLASSWLNTNTGTSGLAVSPDGQTIVYTGYRQNRALVTSDGGTNWTEVTLPGSTWSSSVQNGYHGPTLKYQNGYFMQPGDASNGTYFLSTDGLTWSTHVIPGAGSYVNDFATDGTTFMFASGTYGVIHKTTDHSTWQTLALENSNNQRYWNVEFGNGKWVATNQGDGSSGYFSVSDDAGVTWTLVNPSDYSMPYGNQLQYYNARWTNINHNSVFGFQGIRIQKMRYDSKFNTMVWNHAYYTTANYVLHNCANLSLDNYYMWIYSHYQSDPGVNFNPGVYDQTWSNEYNRWYYCTNVESSWGQSNIFSYDPDTGNLRTEPLVVSGHYAVLSSDIAKNIHSGAAFGPRVHYSGENSSNQWSYWYTNDTQTDIDAGIFWEYPTLQQTVYSGNWNARLVPHKAPNGAGLMMQTAYANTSYLYNKVIYMPSGNLWTNFAWATDTIQFAQALNAGSVTWDTVNQTVTASSGVSQFKNLPYAGTTLGTYPTAEADYDDYKVTLPTGTSYAYEASPYNIYWFGSTDEVSVSTNGGASSLTYPGLNDPPSVIFESQGVFYLVATLGGTGRVYSISDFSTSNYVELSDIGYSDSGARFGWQHVQTSPYDSEANPVMFTNQGQIIQLFSNSNYQPPANLFVYDMNLEEL